MFIEFKAIPWKTFNISRFEPSQIILLKELEERNKELAKIFIYSKSANDYVDIYFSDIWDNKNEKWGVKLF